MEDGCARRRLKFCDEPYKDKSFYIDVKTKSMFNRVSSSITQLGGTVESFLSKDIFMFITDAKTSRLQNHLLKPNQNAGSTISTDISLSSYSPTTGTDSQTFPGVGNQNISLMSRGRALLMKARENSKDSLCTNNSTDSTSINTGISSAVVKAFQMGIKIEHAINFLRKCKSIGVNFKAGKKQKNEEMSGFAPLKWDKNFIKVEDMSKQYRPIFKQIENIPKLYADNCVGSPFDGPTFLQKIQSETTAKKEMKGRKFTQGKGGYCEMCQQWYTKSLKEHMHSSNHLNFVNNKDNFSNLDDLVCQLPNVSNFLAKFVSSTSHCIVDKTKLENSPLEVENVDITELENSSLEVKSVNKIDLENSTLDVESVNKTELENSTLELESVNKTELENSTLELESVNKTEFSSTNDEEMKGLEMENIAKIPMLTDVTELIPLKAFSDGKLFDNVVLNNDADTNMFSTDHSQSESPSNVLKDLLMNWTLQDNVKHAAIGFEEPIAETTPISSADNIAMLDTTCTPVVNDPNYSGSTSVYGGSTSIYGDSSRPYGGSTSVYGDSWEPMSLGTPILSLDRDEDNLADDDRQMKLKIVYENGESVSSGNLSNNCSQGRKKKRKIRKVKNKTDVYCSRKTSETKLKLCKIALTPLQQKCNLKMFWQVRKTGDCKLVFSSKKRKQAREDSITHAGARQTEEEHDRPLKRQRLVF